MNAKIDPKDALKLRKKSLVVVSWYHTSTGFRFGAGRVLLATRKRLKLLLMIPCERAKTIQLEIRHHRLMAGRLEYTLYEANEKEVASSDKLFDQYQSSKLGWRWRAIKRHRLLSDWKYWALRRIMEMSKCGR